MIIFTSPINCGDVAVIRDVIHEIPIGDPSTAILLDSHPSVRQHLHEIRKHLDRVLEAHSHNKERTNV